MCVLHRNESICYKYFQHSHVSYLYIIYKKILENCSFWLFSKKQDTHAKSWYTHSDIIYIFNADFKTDLSIKWKHSNSVVLWYYENKTCVNV